MAGMEQDQQPVVHQQLARLNSEVSALDAQMKGVVAKMEAAQGDKEGLAFYKDIYNNLVAKERTLMSCGQHSRHSWQAEEEVAAVMMCLA